MKIYRSKLNNKLYTIEHLIYDIHFANNGESQGIYAYPYDWIGKEIHFLCKDVDKCSEYVTDNFDIVSEI